MKLKYTLFFVVGVLAGILVTYGMIIRKYDRALDQGTQALAEKNKMMEEMQARLTFDENALTVFRTQLTESRNDLAAKALRETGHVMTEAQCRAWIGVVQH